MEDGRFSAIYATVVSQKLQILEVIYWRITPCLPMCLNQVLCCETLRDAARRCKTLRDAARRCETLRDAARRCETLRDAARRCETLRDAARRCETLREAF
jgi:hypothetical protein